MKLVELPSDALGAVVGHPHVGTAARVVTQLVQQLHDCTSSDDFMDLQDLLFLELASADQRRAEASWMSKRLRAGKQPRLDEIPPPPTGDAADPLSWDVEAASFARFVRQLRSVGDGMAWRLLGYDRRAVLANADNDSAGPLIKRADDAAEHRRGLDAEIAAVRQLHAQGHRTALLNSLTNCMRIGDVTVFSPDGSFSLHEVKHNARYADSRQLKRIEQVHATVNLGAPLPRSGMKVLDLAEEFKSDLNVLSDVAELARERGCQGARLPQGRAIIVTSLIDLATMTDESLAASESVIRAKRSAALRRARIDQASHHIRAHSADQAARMPQMPPWSIYPLPPDLIALVICDLLLFEAVISVDALAEMAENEGMQLLHQLREGRDHLDPERPAMQLRMGTNQLTVFPNSLSPLLYELLQPQSWMRGMSELLSRQRTHPNPWTRFAGDGRDWRPPLPS